MKVIKSLLPKRHLRQKLPLLPRSYSSNTGPDIDAQRRRDIDLLKGNSVARTDHDAMRLLVKHPGKSAQEIIKLSTRKRRFQPWWKTVIRRLKRIWG